MGRNARLLGRIGLGAGAAAAGWVAYSRFFVDHRMPLGPAIDAELLRLPIAGYGELAVYADESASGTPVFLLHSINAAASSYEMRPLFAALRGSRPVFAVDLPGFGLSERSDRLYSPALYAGAIAAVLERLAGSAPAHAVALSLTSELAAAAAAAQPERFASLTLLSPTGFSRRTRLPTSRLPTRLLARALDSALAGQSVFDALATRSSIRYFLAKTMIHPPDPDLVDYAYRSAHQPNARFAPLAFLSGRLFSPNARERIYAEVPVPTLVLHDHDPFTAFDALEPFLGEHPRWEAVRVGPSRGLLPFDQPEAVAAAAGTFFARAEARRPSIEPLPR